MNTAIDDGSDIAKLMQYFKNSTGIHPLFEKLSSQVYHYKEIPEGGNHMASVFDEVREEIEDDKEEPMSIGAQIATLREMYGWTQKQLAEKSGLDRTYISRVESGAISVGMEVLNKIADALGCDVRLVEK